MQIGKKRQIILSVCGGSFIFRVCLTYFINNRMHCIFVVKKYKDDGRGRGPQLSRAKK